MALQKQPVTINFSQGLDSKSDNKQVSPGKFIAMNNSVFDIVGQLTKRNGYKNITTLPNSDQTTLTTLNDNLIATGSNLYAYSRTTDTWLNQGIVQPVKLSVQPLVRVSTSQSSPDAVTSADGLTCLVYVDSTAGACYQVSDSTTGQQIVPRTLLPTGATNPRVVIGTFYFIITYTVTVTATVHLQFIAIPIANPDQPKPPVDISTTVNGLNAGYDSIAFNPTGTATNNINVYVSWAASSTTIGTAYITPSLGVSLAAIEPGHTATVLSLAADPANNNIWISFWEQSSTNGYTYYYDYLLQAPSIQTQTITGKVVNEITSAIVGTLGDSLLTVLYAVTNNYIYAPNARTDYINKVTVALSMVASGTTTILRSVGLASKAFVGPANTIYTLVTYGEINEQTSVNSADQPTYFLIDSNGNIIMRLAYSNGGGYEPTQVLPNVSQIGDNFLVPYSIRDFLTTINKGTNLPSGTPLNGIYTQTGVNQATFSINSKGQYSSEIAGSLHLTGGQLWQYDGVKPVEDGFHVWPDNVAATTSGTGGSIGAGTYYYSFTYEWTDNAGNLQRSAPSIPLVVTTSGATSTTTINVPTLRLTYKTDPNPVRIVGYRWSVAQQVYYQFTSVTSPILNNPAIDSMAIIDTFSDAQILGNAILYTTGGVIENIAPPASIASALFKNRLFLVDAEDQNLIWFSKQVIESVPVEMSDLLTLYVAPTSGAQGSTGPVSALSALDDKLIIFKRDAIYYITGTGPDNTGAQNDFSDPIFITSSVGCANPNSIVLMPNGLMFQSDKGIWLLGRDLSTQYIGAPVEQYNSQIVLKAQAIPATNQVRFILDSNITLMYDYFMQQWGTHSNVLAISATLYNSTDTYLNSKGLVFQEMPGLYVDGSSPVLLSFTTSWFNVAGLQGYERFYQLFLLGSYYTPFKLNVQMAYDYNPSPSQAVIVQPDNYSLPYGGEASWGSGRPWGGGPGAVFEARVFPQKQKCESFQLIVSEVFDNSFGVIPGQGLSLSGLTLMIGLKKAWRTQSAGRSFG